MALWTLPCMALLGGWVISCGGSEGDGTPQNPSTSIMADVGGDLPTSELDSAAADDTATTVTDTSTADAPLPVSERTQARFDLEGEWFGAPFPVASRVRSDGTIRFDDFPNPTGNTTLADYIAAVDRVHTGFSRSAAIFFTFTDALDPAGLPETLDASLAPESAVFLVDIDPSSPERGNRIPVQVAWNAEGAQLRPEHLLTVLPYPGFVLRPTTWYGVVLLNHLTDLDGVRLGTAPHVEALLQGDTVPGATAALVEGFDHLRQTLDQALIAPNRVVTATVFQTGDPDTLAKRLQRHAAARPPAEATVTATLRTTPTLCVVEGQTTVPIYQTGDRPYTAPGSGQFVWEGDEPQVQWVETIRFALALPNGRPMPTEGFPTLFYISGGGGRYTQAIDRGTFAEQEADPDNGRGPAHFAALSGWATVGIEAPLVGPRHPNQTFEPFDFHNPFNLTSFRNNLLQAAVEYTSLARSMATLAFEVAPLCNDVMADEVRLDANRFALMGQSTGSSVGAIVLGAEPMFASGILSGAGGSWIYNVALKQEPLLIAEAVALVLGLEADEPLDPFHPLATLFQTAAEATEAMNFARRWTDAPFSDSPPKNVLLIGGLIDGYFLPRMIAALAMAGRFDLAGPSLDANLFDDITRMGAQQVPLPAGPNRGDQSVYTLLYEADGFDGHYVTFNLGAPKTAYRCWLASLARDGRAVLPFASDNPEAPCP